MKVTSIEDATSAAKLVAMMVPDQHQAAVYRASVEPNLSSGTGLLFAHGFNVVYGQIEAPDDSDVIMVGPKAPGPVVRTTYEAGGGVPTVVAVHQDASGKAMEKALAYAKGIGCTRAGALVTTFEEETETDLFGEQVVLAGAAAAVIRLGYETLVEAGYQPETAYFECLHELKLVVELIQQNGIAGMGRAISDTAEYGSLTRGPRAYGEPVREAMRDALREIQSGRFAKEWLEESSRGAPRLEEERRKIQEHPIEVVGERLRKMMDAARPEQS
jgi:ketol-acid reductoisomerase